MRLPRSQAAPGLAFFCALLVCVLAPEVVAPAADAAPGVTFHARADSVQADESRQWAVDLTVGNTGEWGLHLDSLVLVSTPLSGPHAGQSTRASLPFGLSEAAVGAGEEHSFGLKLPAAHVATRLVFELSTRAHDVVNPVSSVTVLGGAYDPARLHPPVIARISGRAVELTRLPATSAANGMGLLLLGEEGADPVAVLDQGVQLSSQGFTVVVVQPPGAGGSQGPADLAGPASLAAAEAGLDSLANMPDAEPSRLAAWGKGTGGTLALLLAHRSAKLAVVIAEGASADPWATYRALPADARAAFVKEAGRDSAAWKARSPRANLAGIKAAVLILHGEKDAVSPCAAARELAAALGAQGTTVESNFDAASGHDLPANLTRRIALKFLRAHAGKQP